MAAVGARVRTRLFRPRRGLRDRLLADPDLKTVREDLAARYLRGDGLELGALNLPLRLPAGARVRYVDRKAVPEEDWPEMAGQGFAPVDVVDDAQTLATVPDGSQDFVVANHVLEHLEDPIAALEAFARVLRPGGVAYIALPEHERTFDAPRERVWKAFTDPELVPRWWGPHGTTTTVVEMDVRPGGTWRYVSRASDRDDVTFYGEYLEVDPPKRLEWTFMFDVEGVGPMGGPETFTFDEVDGKTKVTSVGHMGSVEALEGALASGMVKGAVETWDRLATLLAKG